MKMLNLPKRILREFVLFIIVLCFCFSNIDVNAKTKLEACSDKHNTDLISLYGVSIESSKDNKSDDESKYKIKMSIKSDDKSIKNKLNKTEFTVVKINGVDVTSRNIKIKPNNKAVSGIISKEDFKGSGQKRISIVFESFKEYTIPNLCQGKIRIEVIYTKGGEARVRRINTDIPDGDTGSESSSGKIVCKNNNYTDEFRKEFCEAKLGAEANQKDDNTDENNKPKKKYTYFDEAFGKNLNHSKIKNNDKITFKCDYKNLYTDEQIAQNYYRNKRYVYGSGEYTMNFGKYKYHYAPDDQDTQTSPEVSCKVKCEEAVTVEYGPPVASKAGLCFEYKIKVTSRVNCFMSEKPKKPDIEKQICTPTPICTNLKHSYELNVGGPNEVFDSCIKNCDGGKYTDSCSNKCYQQVYGKTGVNESSNNLVLSSIQKLANKNTYKVKEGSTRKDTVNKREYANKFSGGFDLGTCKNLHREGCYTYSNNAIVWEANEQPWGRWYTPRCPDGYNVFPEEGNGICRHDYGSDHCHDICWWTGCGKGQYLNEQFAIKDKENNQKIYENAIKECKAAVKCQTTTTEFKISVNYKHNLKNEPHINETINFPYERKIDKLSSHGENFDQIDTSSEEDSTILSRNGCYKNKSARKWYQAEWSFPGTWIQKKTGEISYDYNNKDSRWKEMKEKFCIPLDALDVNEKWWRYYYNKILKPESSTKNTSFTDVCGNNSESVTNKKTYSDSDANEIVWNIIGSTKKFGYYKWNIDVKCFYALSSNPAKISTNSTNNSTKDKCLTDDPNPNDNSTNYRIRPVDLTNLFPATDGSSITDYTKTGRTPGFNWSQYASAANKNNVYFNNGKFNSPSEYAKEVQRLGYKVYSDENLDYEFYLTRDILNNMKKRTKSSGNDEKKYTNFEGETEVQKDGVIHYVSNTIRNGNELAKAKKRVPDSGDIFCNNMKNYIQGCK